jgi:N-acylneuraminate cytidylyltransferase
MKKETIAFFLPTRKGSERVKKKNTRPFAGVEDGLIGNKIAQLVQSRLIDEIIISSNDEECIKIAEKYNDSRIRIMERPEYLCTSQTNLQDLIMYVPTITDAEHILWGHVTTPIIGAEEYDKAIERYFASLEEGYDSLVGVKELRNFLLNHEGRIINNTTDIPWPRTQDLETLYEINHTMFITSRGIYQEKKNRLGDRPYLYVMNEMLSFDIDWEEDFKMAEMIYAYMKNNGLMK